MRYMRCWLESAAANLFETKIDAIESRMVVRGRVVASLSAERGSDEMLVSDAVKSTHESTRKPAELDIGWLTCPWQGSPSVTSQATRACGRTVRKITDSGYDHMAGRPGMVPGCVLRTL